MVSLTLILLFCVPALIQSAADWSYASRKEWARKNRYCAGHSQSPIDVRFSASHYDRRLKQLSLEEHQPAGPAELVNSGYTAQLNLKGRYVLKNVAPESEDYNVEQLHFHWGQQDDYVNGSEHLRDGKSFPLEMHVVAYSSSFSNIHDAARNIRSLAVVGFFFEISEEDNPALKPLIDGLNNVRSQGATPAPVEHFDLKGLIGNERLDRYYRYDGSLTTPPCFESVLWSVVLEPLKISRQQLFAFHILQDRNAQAIKNTFRAVKQLGARKLLRSFHSVDLDEDRQQRLSLTQNDAHVSKMDMKLAVALASVLLLVVA